MRDRSDAELVEACRRGDEAAWREIVRRYIGLVRSVCAKTGARGPDIGERAQDVFGEFARSIHVIREPNALPRWFVTASRRITWRWILIERRTPGEVPEDLIDTRKDPEAAFEELQLRHRIGRAIEKMGRTCQVILRALFFSDPPLSYAQLAQELGLAEGSIGPMKQRCIERLRKLLGEE